MMRRTTIIVICVFMIWLTSSVVSADDPDTEPLSKILIDFGNANKNIITTAATARSKDGDLEFKSVKKETRIFKGWFLSARNNPSMAVLSDDGVDVIIKSVGGEANTVLNRFGTGQHLADTEKSLHFLEPPALAMSEATLYEMTVRYSNTIYTGETDRDGVTLYAYDGGGNELAIVLMGRNKLGDLQESQDRFILDADSEFTRRVIFKIDKPNGLVGAAQTAFNNKLRWTLSDVGGIGNDQRFPTPAWEPGSEMAKGIGPSRINFTQLPPTNQGWGEKTLTLDVIEGGQPVVSLTETPRLFFDPIDKSHPGPDQGKTANWHYYWSLEGDPAVCAFSRTPGNPKYAKWVASVPGHPGAYGVHNPENGEIAISDVAAKQTNGWPPYIFPENGVHDDWIHFEIEVKNAPDFVNLVFAHEMTHRQLNALNLNLDNDKDRDGVPDVWEERIPGMKSNSDDSFAGAFTISDGSAAKRDEEFYAVLSGALKKGTKTATVFGKIIKNPPTGNYEGGLAVDADESKDWSKDSVNWNKED